MNILGTSTSFFIWCLIAYTAVLLITIPLAARYITEAKKNIELNEKYSKSQEILKSIEELLKEIKEYFIILKDRDSRFAIKTTKIPKEEDNEVYNLGEYIVTKEEIEQLKNTTKKPRKIDRIKSINNED